MRRIAPHVAIDACRSCGSSALTPVIAFGETPLADGLTRPDDATPEYVAPLTLLQCRSCGLCQIRETVEPSILFGADYPYYSSVSPALLKHFRDSAAEIMERRGLGAGSLVVEAASNDGYMLQPFAEAGVDVLGIDPAPGPAAEARRKGIDTLGAFFNARLAAELAAEGRRADVFLANNVLAHVADTRDFVAGIETLLAPDGIAVLEFPYLGDLVAHRAFDTIYHQHLLYLTARAACDLFEGVGLSVNDAKRLKVHGGSLRIRVSRWPGRTERLQRLLADEDRRGMGTPAYFRDFIDDMAKMKVGTRDALARMRAEGKRVAGYGAAAKATTLLHHFGLDRRHLDYIVDRSAWKQGLLMPGTRIPIDAPERLYRDRPDAVLILAWNFAAEIAAENAAYLEGGGTFLVPVPELRLVDARALEVSL